jgi:hypothetical protein
MPTVLDPVDAVTIGGLLGGVPFLIAEGELAEAAGFWSAEVCRPSLEAADVQTVAWLLADLSRDRHLPQTTKDLARYWAEILTLDLEARWLPES